MQIFSLPFISMVTLTMVLDQFECRTTAHLITFMQRKRNAHQGKTSFGPFRHSDMRTEDPVYKLTGYFTIFDSV